MAILPSYWDILIPSCVVLQWCPTSKNWTSNDVLWRLCQPTKYIIFFCTLPCGADHFLRYRRCSSRNSLTYLTIHDYLPKAWIPIKEKGKILVKRKVSVFEGFIKNHFHNRCDLWRIKAAVYLALMNFVIESYSWSLKAFDGKKEEGCLS